MISLPPLHPLTHTHTHIQAPVSYTIVVSCFRCATLPWVNLRPLSWPPFRTFWTRTLPALLLSRQKARSQQSLIIMVSPLWYYNTCTEYYRGMCQVRKCRILYRFVSIQNSNIGRNTHTVDTIVTVLRLGGTVMAFCGLLFLRLLGLHCGLFCVNLVDNFARQ